MDWQGTLCPTENRDPSLIRKPHLATLEEQGCKNHKTDEVQERDTTDYILKHHKIKVYLPGTGQAGSNQQQQQHGLSQRHSFCTASLLSTECGRRQETHRSKVSKKQIPSKKPNYPTEKINDTLQESGMAGQDELWNYLRFAHLFSFCIRTVRSFWKVSLRTEKDQSILEWWTAWALECSAGLWEAPLGALVLDALRKHSPWSIQCFEHGAILSRLQAPHAAILVIQMWESFITLTKDFFQG